MTKKIFNRDNSTMSVTTKGAYPTHSVVGNPSAFYVFLLEKKGNSWSEWIRGDNSIYHKLFEMHKKHELQPFVSAVEDLWQKNQKV